LTKTFNPLRRFFNFPYQKFLKILKKLFSKSFLSGVWGSAPNIKQFQQHNVENFCAKTALFGRK